MVAKILRLPWLIGPIFDISLFILGFIVAGGGHGSYALIGCFSSPCGFLGIPVAFMGIPILWVVIGFLLMFTRYHIIKMMFLFIILIHYAGIPIILFYGDYGDIGYFKESWDAVPSFVMLGIIVYLIGQVGIWATFVKNTVASGKNSGSRES